MADGFEWDYGDEKRAHDAVLELANEYPKAARSLLEEAGLLMEFTGKQEIHVDTGRLRASWGHYTPQDLTGKKGSRGTTGLEAKAAAVFEVSTQPTTSDILVVRVGTTVAYAAPHNYRHRTYFAEKSLTAAVSALPALAKQYMDHMRRKTGLR